MLNKQPKYEVEEIVDETIIDNQPHYLIKWEGFSHQHDTWEPISNLGSILGYLQHWIEQRQIKNMKEREKEKTAHFGTIKPYIYRENLQPRRRSARQQYAEEEEESKRRLTRQRFGEKLLKRKKTWEKYLQYDRNHIDLVEGEEQEQKLEEEQEGSETNNCEDTQINKIQEQSAHSQPQSQTITSHQRMQQTKQDQPAKPAIPAEQNVQPKAKDAFKVVGFIDPSKIVKICETFSFKGVTCALVQYEDGRQLNMKQSDIQCTNPALLRDYYNT